MEDVFRFYYDEKGFQTRLKELRHGVAMLLDWQDFVESRGADSDVGIDVEGGLEYDRATLIDVVRSNLKRAEEGLRVLEETLKLEGSERARGCHKLRYQTYHIEKEIQQFLSRPRLEKGLYLVLSDPSDPEEFAELARSAVRAGIPAVQLRCRDVDDGALLNYAKQMRDITANTKTLFIVNDRVDIALLANADGVHIGQSDIPAASVREILGGDRILGLSTHNLQQARAAQNLPLDYIGFGPVWPTDSKVKPDPVVGVDNLRECVKFSKLPVVAIGGINRSRMEDMAEIAYNNIAVIRAVRNVDDPEREMAELMRLSTGGEIKTEQTC